MKMNICDYFDGFDNIAELKKAAKMIHEGNLERLLALEAEVTRLEEQLSHNGIVPAAKALALKKHASQLYGNQPYSKHLEEVVSLCEHYNLGYDAQTVGWLHDIIEDTDVTTDDIQQIFGERIALAVRDISNGTDFSMTLRIIAQNPLSRVVKLCDRLANMRNSVDGRHKYLRGKYIKQYPEFRTSLFSWVDKKVLWNDLDIAYENLLEGDKNEPI